jgi:glycosyltransferase involved in cell wall biosynthesis
VSPARARSAVFILVDYVPETGGTTTQTRLEGGELRRRGWDVDVLTRRQSIEWAKTEQIDGIAVHRFGRPGYTKLSKGLDLLGVWWRLLSTRRDDVVQVMMDADYAVATALAGRTRATVIMWATEGDATKFFNGPKGAVRRTLIRGCGHVVLTARMQEELAEKGIPGATIIPVPVDSVRFEPATEAEREAQRASLGITAATVIAFSGHLVARKGADLLLAAFAQMVENGADVHLLLLGSGAGRPESQEEQLRADTQRLGLSDRVTFADAVQDVAPYLKAGDIFCLPSWREGMPNSILEAMASGLACVAPESAGGADLLNDGAGVIPASNSADDLRAAIEPLLKDPELRRALGRAARQRAESRHSVAAVIDAYDQVWTSRRTGGRGLAVDGGAQTLE